MIDPAALFDDLWRAFKRDVESGTGVAPAGTTFASHIPVLARIGCVPARIAVEKTAWGRCFTPHPNVARASNRSWAFILAVKSHCQLDDDFWRKCRLGLCEDGDIARHHVFGGEVIDLVAVSLDFERVYGRLNGHTPVLGYPQEMYCDGTDKPVRLYGSVKKWIENFCAGVVMIGDEAENLDWLRQCEGGIITDDLSAGERLMKQLRRPYQGPRVLVAA